MSCDYTPTTRTRTRQSVPQTRGLQKTVVYNGVTTVSTLVQDYIESKEAETIRDHVIPNYNRMRNQILVVPTNPLEVDRSTFAFPPATYSVGHTDAYMASRGCGWENRLFADWRQYGEWPTNALGGHADGALEWGFDQLDQVYVQALADARSGQNLDALTAMAEAKSTLSYLEGRGKDVYDELRRFTGKALRKDLTVWDPIRKVRVPKTTKAQIDLNSLWLEYRYAITPLALDVEGAITQLNEGALMLIKGTALDDKTFTSNRPVVLTKVNGTLPWSYPEGAPVGHEVHTSHVSVKAYAKYSSDILALGGITASPLTTLWELVTYSFIIDWFINLGDMMRAAGPTGWMTFHDGGVVLKCESTSRITPASVDINWEQCISSNQNFLRTAIGNVSGQSGTSSTTTVRRYRKCEGIPDGWRLRPHLKINLKKVVDVFALFKKLPVFDITRKL